MKIFTLVEKPQYVAYFCEICKFLHARAHTHAHTHTHIYVYSGLSIVERFDARKKKSRKIRFETRIKIRKSNQECGIAQQRAAHATVSQQIRTRLGECCWSVCASARPVLP